MAKRQTIVIKKVYVVAAGHHGGSWKVALADFMTAMMAFFLVMWLIGQSEDSKKAVSDYFSTPSVIEYNFQNFGAELTLEKLFLDFINEPLKAVQSFVEPADKTPNILDMGSAKVIASFMADKMTDTAKNVNISQDGFEFDIPDTYLFEKGTATPNKKYIEVMNRLIQITSGLEDSEVKLTSALFTQVVANQSEELAKNVAQDRLDTFSNKIKATFEHSSNEVKGTINVRNKKGEVDAENLMGFMRISIKQKQNTDKPKRKIQSMFGDKGSGKSVYDSFAGQVVNRQEVPKLKKEGFSPNLVNPAEAELKHIEHEGDPSQSENNADKIQQ